MVSHCAQYTHLPTHWQTFFTRPTLRLLRNRFPGEVAISPSEGLLRLHVARAQETI